MSDLENSEIPTKDLSIMESSSYPYIGLGALIVLGIAYLLYHFMFASNYLDSLKDSVPEPANLLETMKQFLGKVWLGSIMEHGAIKVDNDAKDGLLNKMVERTENLDI